MIVTLGAGHIDPRIAEIEAEVARRGMSDAVWYGIDAASLDINVVSVTRNGAVGMVEAAVLPVVAQAKTGAFPPSATFPSRALAFGAQRIGFLVGPY